MTIIEQQTEFLRATWETFNSALSFFKVLIYFSQQLIPTFLSTHFTKKHRP